MLHPDNVITGFSSIDTWRTEEAIAERDERQAVARAAHPRESRFGRISFGEIRARKVKAPDFVVDDWMVAREQSMLAGESQSGKSFLAIHAALAISAGMEIFGRRVSPGLVIYQAGESGSGVLDLRIPAWIQHFAGADLQLPFEILPAKVDLWSPEGNAKAFIETVQAIAAEHHPTPLRAVFIDTLSKAMAGANENDGRDVSRVLANAETISRETGAHVCIVHHFPKGGKTLRGHGSLKADVDTVALVHVDEATKVRTITFDKVKDGERGGNLQFELMQVKLGEREGDGKPITSCVVLPVGEKALARQDAMQSAAVSPIEKTLLESLFKAVDSHGILAPVGLDVGAMQRVVEWVEVKRAFAEMSPNDDLELLSAIGQQDNDEAREASDRRHRAKLKARLQRAREFMTVNTKIIRVGSCPDPVSGKPTVFVWWTGRPVRGFPRTQPPKPKEERVSEALAEGGDWIDHIL